MRTCSLPECEAKHYAKTYCELHYQRWRAHGDPRMVKERNTYNYSNRNPDVRREHILSRIDKSTGCWIWLGTKTAAGYGQMRGANGSRVYTHRVAYELFVGEIPEGLVLDHLCRNPACCNPEHVEPVTQRINVERGLRGTPRRTHCPRGHLLSGGNVRFTKLGHRVCVPCDRAWQKQRRDRMRELRPPAPHYTCGAAGAKGPCARRVKVKGGLCWEHGRMITDVQPGTLERLDAMLASDPTPALPSA